MKQTIQWMEIRWPRPLEMETAQEVIAQLATMERGVPLIWELRASKGRVRYLLGAEAHCLKQTLRLLQSGIQGIRMKPCAEREDIHYVRQIRASHPQLSLNTQNTMAVIRATLAALVQTKHSNEETVIQIVLGKARTPSLLPAKLADPKSSWLDALRGTVSPATSESRKLLRDKITYHGFDTVLRIGASADTPTKAIQTIQNVLSGLKVVESAGAKLDAVSEKSASLNQAICPWHFPMRLSIKELTGFLCWPLGDGDLPGVAGLHSRMVLPPSWLRHSDRVFGMSPFDELRLGIPPKDSLEHCHILGGTGAGKSTVMLNLIMADIHAGRSVLVIDPKSDLIHDVLERIPSGREKDVVVLDPSDTCPVGFNPLADQGKESTLTADAILAVLREIYADSWGPRTNDILSSALITLAQIPGASLVWLPALLTDERFRRKCIKNLSDPIGLGSFWAGFEAMSQGERSQAIAPVMNKIRSFLLRPQLRAMLGQAKPAFSLMDLFYQRKIVLVPLNKGLIGHENARLLGSLIVSQLWTLALSRAGIPPEKRHIVGIYIDEMQDYLSLPTDLADALSQARGMGISLTLAHQYRAQLPASLRAGVDTNARNKIVFGLSAADAKDMAAMAPGLCPEDFMLLPRYRIYAHLLYNGKSTGWIQGRTLPATPAIRPAHEVKALSMQTYGKPIVEVERECLAALGYSHASHDETDEPIGRKKRSPQDE